MCNSEEQGKNEMTEVDDVETRESAAAEEAQEASPKVVEDETSVIEESNEVASEEGSKDEETAELEEGALAEGNTPNFKWYVVKTMTGQENKVSKALRERIVNTKLTEYFSDILVPEETVVSNVNGKKRRIKKKFFPGYVLCKMIMNEKTWHMIKATDKITGFVGGTKEMPAPLSDEEAAYMTNQAQEGFKQQRTAINFTEGETVKVIEGPFASFVGTVEAVSDKGKVKVNVSIFGRPTPVELDFTQVEKIS